MGSVALGQKFLSSGGSHKIGGYDAALKASRVNSRACDCALDGFNVDGATLHALHLLNVVCSIERYR